MYLALHFSGFVAICSAFFASAPTQLVAQVYLALAPGLCCMQTNGAFGVDVLLVLRPSLGPSPAQRFRVASAALGFLHHFLETITSAVSFRRLDSHQSCALGTSRRTTTAGGLGKILETENQHSKRHWQRISR